MTKSSLNVLSFTPLDSKVLVKVFGTEKSSIIVPDTAKDKYLVPFGEVIAAGPGRTTEHGAFIPMDLVPGDMIQVSQWQGQAVEVKGQILICMERAFIIGKIVPMPKGLEVLKGGKN